MVEIIPDLWKKIWDKWDIRGVILFSLGLQIFLILFGASRKRTKGWLLKFLWLAYLLADWAASFCIGLISNNPKSNSTITKNEYLTAFWAPFLLLHLGGPDTITAFALEDNELWLRHLLGLIFQAVTTGYIFFSTLPKMMFLAGLIKYGERTRALYLASMDGFRQSLFSEPDPGPDYAMLMEEFSSIQHAGIPVHIVTIDPEALGISGDDDQEDRHGEEKRELEVVRKAYFFFQMFKGLIVGKVYSFNDRRKSQKYFKGLSPEEALRVIEIELNFMYEAFYTKVSVIRHWFGYLCKFGSFVSIMLALVLFISADKHGFNRFDVCVTYALLYGALALETMAFSMAIFTEYTTTLLDKFEDLSGASQYRKFKYCLLKCFNEKILKHFLRLKRPNYKEIVAGEHYEFFHQLSTSCLFRRWFGSISGFNFMKYSFGQSTPHIAPASSNVQIVFFRIMLFVKSGFRKTIKYFGCGDIIDQLQYQDKNPFLTELWEYIFFQLMVKSDDVDVEDPKIIQSICSTRGEWVLKKMEIPGIQQRLKPFVDASEVSFDQSIILWHIATNLCYRNIADHADHGLEVDSRNPWREFSMLLSDYMLYLLIAKPTMMSTVAGIGKIRFQATCAEASKFFSKRNIVGKMEARMRTKACDALMGVPTEIKSMDVKGDRSISSLFDACRLAHELDKFKDETKKWGFIASMWVEMLSFAASECRATAHVKVLSEGGELISLVWLLMVQLGLGKQFQFKDAKVKIVVAK